MNTAILLGLITDNPAKQVKRYKERPMKQYRVPTDQEFPKILGASSPILHSVLIVGANSGMRTKKIYQLEWKYVDFKNEILTVTNTKNGKDRTIPMNTDLIEELKRIKSEQTQNSPYVFPNTTTGEPITTVRNSWRKVCKELQLDDIRLYDATRHKFGTDLARAGVPIHVIKDLMGHSSIKMTERYMHLDMNDKRQAVQKISSKSGPIASKAKARRKRMATNGDKTASSHIVNKDQESSAIH
jgi:integrase